MAADDLSKMNLEALKKHIAELDKKKLDAQALLKSKREEELTMLAAAYAQKLQAGGFTMAEGLTALEPHETGKRTRALRGSLPPKEPKPYKDGLVYKDPNSSNTWTGGTRGRLPSWLRKLTEDLSGEALVKKYADLSAASTSEGLLSARFSASGVGA